VQEPAEGGKLFLVTEYYKDGTKKSVGSSSKVDPPRYEGAYVSYYHNGKKKQVANFLNGQHVDSLLSYYPNGVLYTAGVYISNHTDKSSVYKIVTVNDSTGKSLVSNGTGTYIVYDGNFKNVTARGMLKNGQYDGIWTGEDKKQHLTFKETYIDGKLISGESTDEHNETVNYTERETLPAFKGGMTSFYKYLARSVKYPDNLVRQRVQGVVILKFSVEKDGSITDIRVVNYVQPEMAAEAVRVLKASPLWEPGVQRGRKVRVAYSIPITFSLSR
jgi:TonB family protein